MKLLIVINTSAGYGDGAIYDFMRLALGDADEACVRYTDGTTEPASLVHDAKLYDLVVVSSGDGTIASIARELAYSGVPLLPFPAGTANLLAAKLGISTNFKKALRVIQKKNIKTIDAIKINDKQCILRCGLGYDSDIICKTPQSLKNKFGYLAYFIAGIIFALRLTPKTYNITCDDKTFVTDSTCIIVANAGNMYKNIVSLANNSSVDDGLFDVFILNTKNPLSFFIEFLRIVLGIKKDNKRAKYFQAKSLKIQNSWAVCHIDGEKTKFNKDIEIKIIPDAINVFSN